MSSVSGTLGGRSSVSTAATTITVPNHLMARLVGPLNENLRLVEDAFPGARIIARGNEFTIDGEDAGLAARSVEELRLLLEQGHAVDPQVVHRTIDMVRADERPSEVLTSEVLRSARGRSVRPKTSGQKRYADAIAANVITFGIGPAGTGKSYLAVALAVQALQAKQVDRIILTRPAVEAGERLGFLPGDLMAKIDPYLRPLYDALYDMLGTEGARRLLEAGHGRGGPAGLHAGPHAQQQLHHPRRGPEHHARADEDVPHPHRLRLARSSSPATSPRSTCPGGRSGLVGLEEILDRHRRAGLRPPRPAGRGPPPHRAGHRERLRGGDRGRCRLGPARS